MALCSTPQWSGATTPQVTLTVTQQSSNDTQVVLAWTLKYVTHGYTANTNGIGRDYNVTIDGDSVKTGTFDIDGKSTTTIASGTKTVNKTTSSRDVSFGCSFGFNITWSDVYGGTKTASGSISIGAKTSYTIAYNVNGGSGEPNSQTKWHGEPLKLSSAKPSRVGYAFSQWNTKSDGSGTSYSSGANYTSDATVTLYAIWAENVLTVNYYSNYATKSFAEALNAVGADKNVIVRTSDYYYDNDYSDNGHWDYSFTDSSTYLGRTGYTATGYWGTTPSGGILVKQSTGFSSGQAMAEAVGKSLKNGNASVDLYAQWQINAYAITYNANGGTGNIASQSVNWNETFVVSDNLFAKEGYKFVGWNLYRNDDNKWYVATHGWMTEDEIAANGYSKLLYQSQRELTLGESWIKGNEAARQFTFYAIWEISGVVHMRNQSEVEPYIVGVFNGADWDLYIAGIYNGTNWDIIS